MMVSNSIFFFIIQHVPMTYSETAARRSRIIWICLKSSKPDGWPRRQCPRVLAAVHFQCLMPAGPMLQNFICYISKTTNSLYLTRYFDCRLVLAFPPNLNPLFTLIRDLTCSDESGLCPPPNMWILHEPCRHRVNFLLNDGLRCVIPIYLRI